MLLHLHVKNLALIEETEVEFGNGLNILTGETGAGKSIILGSINLALGQRVSREMIRDESKPMLVELVFDVDEECRKKLENMDIAVDNSEVIISRKITGQRSISRINGETVPVTMLKQVAEYLIDIHGQHEHQSLLKREKHLEILDKFAGKKLENVLVFVREYYDKYVLLNQKITEFTADVGDREREIGFLEYEIGEIDKAKLVPGEDEILETDFRRMQNGQKITEGLGRVYHLTTGDGNGSAGDYLSLAVRELSSLASFDGELGDLYDQMQQLEGLLADFNRDLEQYMGEMEFSEEDFVRTQERLDEINRLKNRYGNTIENILERRHNMEEKLMQLRDYEKTVERMKEEKKEIYRELEKYCEKASEIRRECALSLAKRIRDALVDLNFMDVQFQIDVEQLLKPSANGWDRVEFLISTNPGEPVRALGKVASGGELSRIMLAIKTIFADKDEIETLIFDEIDTGISGRTAQKVSEKMSLIGKSRQIICITHLPQIAAMADRHFVIEKTADKQATQTDIRMLEETDVVQELARMLGGAQITDTVIENAREMKELANQTK